MARRPGGPARLRAITTSVACPTTSRPSRIHDSPSELEADPRPLPDRGGHRAGEPRWFEDEEGDPGPAGQGGEPAEPIGEPRGALGTGWQVDDEEVHGPARQERSGHREALIRLGRREDDEPFRPDPAGHGLDRIEGIGEVQPGDDGAARLGLRGEPQGDRRPPAGEVAAQGEAHAARQAAGPEDGVERREAGGVDAGGIRGDAGSGRVRPDIRQHWSRYERERTLRQRRQRQGPDHLADGGAARPRPSAIEGSRVPPSRPGKGPSSGQVSNICSNESTTDSGRGSGPSTGLPGALEDPVLHSRPVQPPCVLRRPGGDVAQLEEHRVRIAGVRGSSPLISTTSLPLSGCRLSHTRDAHAEGHGEPAHEARAADEEDVGRSWIATSEPRP